MGRLKALLYWCICLAICVVINSLNSIVSVVASSNLHNSAKDESLTNHALFNPLVSARFITSHSLSSIFNLIDTNDDVDEDTNDDDLEEFLHLFTQCRLWEKTHPDALKHPDVIDVSGTEYSLIQWCFDFEVFRTSVSQVDEHTNDNPKGALEEFLPLFTQCRLWEKTHPDALQHPDAIDVSGTEYSLIQWCFDFEVFRTSVSQVDEDTNDDDTYPDDDDDKPKGALEEFLHL